MTRKATLAVGLGSAMVAVLALAWSGRKTGSFLEELPKEPRVQSDAGKAETILAFVDALHRELGIDGYVLIASSGKVLAERGYGTVKLSSDTGISSKTGFVLASLSKQFTAAAVLTLERNGHLSTRDKICRYISEFCADHLAAISIEQLLTHTSGLPRDAHGRWDNLLSMVMHFKLPDTWEPASASKIELVAEPGTSEIYSNLGYQVLARVIELASAVPYPAAMTELVFAPAGLATAKAYAPGTPGCFAELAQARWAVRKSTGEVHRWPIPYVLMNDRSYGADGIVASAQDLLKWDTYLRSGQGVIDERTLVRLSEYAGDSYTHGWAISESGANSLLWHTGVRIGYATGMFRFLEAGYTVIYLFATDAHEAEVAEALTELNHLISGEPYRAPKNFSGSR